MKNSFKPSKPRCFIKNIVFIASCFLLLQNSSAYAGCTSGCTTSRWQERASMVFGGMGGGQPTIRDVVLVGFGYGIVDDSRILNGGNPPIAAASVTWHDFRFYTSVPDFGIFKGSLNRDKTSSVSLNATSPAGIFPAEFQNSLYLNIESINFPIVFQNSVALQTSGPSVSSAPPEQSFIASQIGSTTFNSVSAVPGALSSFVISDGIQSFPPLGGLDLEIDSINSKNSRFKVGNPHDKPLTIAYFAHTNDADSNPSLFQHLDGVLEVAALSTTTFSINLAGTNVDSDSRIFIDAAVLNPPLGFIAYDRLVLTNQGVPTAIECVPGPPMILLIR